MCGVRGEILRAEDIPDYKPQPEEDAIRDYEDEQDEQSLKLSRYYLDRYTEVAESSLTGLDQKNKLLALMAEEGKKLAEIGSGGHNRNSQSPDGGNEDEQGRRKRIRREDSEEMTRLGLLVPNLELATGCSPDNLPGGPPSLLAQTLTQRILTLLHTTHLLRMGDLRLWFHPRAASSTPFKPADEGEDEDLARPSVKAFWALYIDILFISLDGNAFDAAWLSVLAALKDTRLPRAWWDGDRETVLCSDDPSEARVLDLYDMPVALSFGIFEGDGESKGKRWVLVDMDGFEEGLCREGGTVVIGDGGRVVRMEKNGGGVVGVKEVRDLVERAKERRMEWIRVLG